MPNDVQPFTAFNFEVKLIVDDAAGLGMANPLAAAEFAECDGLEMTMEPKTLKEGGNNTTQVHLMGRVSYGNLTLKRGMTPNLDLWNWFRFAMSGSRRGLKAHGFITMKDGNGAPVITFEVFDCLPIKLKAPSLNAKDGGVAIEEMQVTYGSFEVVPV